MRSIDGIPGEECANVFLQIIFWPVLKTLLKLGYFISNLYLAIQSNERQNEWFVEFIPIILILRPAVHGVCFGLQVVGRGYGIFRACLHGGGRPQVGEVTRVGGVTRLSTWSLILIWSRLHDRWGDPQPVISPTRGPPPPCEQALRLVPRPNRFIFRSFFPENGSSASPMSRAYSCSLSQHTQNAAQVCDCSINLPNSYILVVALVLFVRNHFKVKRKSLYVNFRMYSFLFTFFHFMNVCVYFGNFEETAALARVAASFLLKRKRKEF